MVWLDCDLKVAECICRHGQADNNSILRSTRRGAWLLCGILLSLQPQISLAVTPLTDWRAGIATNYGGPYDGKNPYDPSWGTLEVSHHPPSHSSMKPCLPLQSPLQDDTWLSCRGDVTFLAIPLVLSSLTRARSCTIA